MHFRASPATFFTGGDERIHFTKHSFRHCFDLLRRATNVLSVAQALLRWKMCTCVGRGALMLPPREIATQQISFSFALAPGGRFVCTAAYSFRSRLRSKHAC